MNQNSVESSVLFSLAELQRMEQDRIGAEEHQQARERERRERERREAEAERNGLEQARLLSEREAAVQRARRDAETQAREHARVQSALEVARIEAEAKIRLATAEYERTHELASLRAQTHAGLYRVCVGLSVALGVVLCAAAFGIWRVGTDLDQAKHEVLQLQLEREEVVRNRDDVSSEFAEARQRWQERQQALNRDLSVCETQLDDRPPSTTSIEDIKRPPPAEHHPPRPPCEAGDPLCDMTHRPR